jgi:hypothetical protein
MITGTVLRHSRVDILLPGQSSGATALFLYSGEVQCNFGEGDGNIRQDQLVFDLPDGSLLPTQVIGFPGSPNPKVNRPVPTLQPSNSNILGTESLIAVDNAELDIAPSGSGLQVKASIAVSRANLNVISYQVAVRVA